MKRMKTRTRMIGKKWTRIVVESTDCVPQPDGHVDGSVIEAFQQ
jgi:hypothetical protein